jgi:hypothetical protein
MPLGDGDRPSAGKFDLHYAPLHVVGQLDQIFSSALRVLLVTASTQDRVGPLGRPAHHGIAL